ncbi:exodeoxyribonuclease VII large subunit [Chitinispirillum alkaliphilum]|nr:exodeoxyribonuclease VII large subunit [Chitinispirillum alkaliphilum]
MISDFGFLPPSEANQPYTVSEINAGIANLIESASNLVWVEGEISNWKKASSGHCYLRLKDEQSQIPAVIWRETASQLDFNPKDGVAVFAIGSIKVYQKGGYYQLTIHKLIPAGKGALFQAFEQLKEKLAAEGLFDHSKKKPLPDSISSVGVITSKQGAAIRDIVRVIADRSPQTDIILTDVAVQGAKAPADIVNAIEMMNDHTQTDCIIVGRGGGSIEDLWAFNDENVARAIFNSSIPVISAVGHETDFTISDFVADYRAATPSAAAEIAVSDCKEDLRYFEVCSQRFVNSFTSFFASSVQRYNRACSSRSLRTPLRIVEEAAQSYDEAQEKCYKALHANLHIMRNRLEYAGGRLQSLSPLSVLQRGYSVTVNSKGKTVRNSKELKSGEKVQIRFSQGSADAIINQVLPPEQ